MFDALFDLASLALSCVVGLIVIVVVLNIVFKTVANITYLQQRDALHRQRPSTSSQMGMQVVILLAIVIGLFAILSS